MTELDIYDELTMSLQALRGLDDLLSGGSHEVDPTSISLLMEPIVDRLQKVKNAMKALQDTAPAKPRALPWAANQELVA